MITAVTDTQKRIEKRKIRKELKKYGILHKDVAAAAGLHLNRMVELLRVWSPYYNEALVAKAWEMIGEKKEQASLIRKSKRSA